MEKKIDFTQKFYAKRNGKVVACKFEHLYVWFSLRCSWDGLKRDYSYNESNVSYALIFADGSKENGYYQWMPSKVYETIEDCIADKNDIGRYVNEHGRTRGTEFDVRDYIKYLDCVPTQEFYRDCLGMSNTCWKAWRWDGFKPIYEYITDGGACRSEAFFNLLTMKFEFPNKRYYSTEEECKKANCIEVIDF